MPVQNVVITEQQAAFIKRMVDSGQYGSAEELLFEGINLVELIHTSQAARLQALRAAVQAGIDCIERGDYTEFESASALAEDFRAEAARIIAEVEAGKAA